LDFCSSKLLPDYFTSCYRVHSVVSTRLQPLRLVL